MSYFQIIKSFNLKKPINLTHKKKNITLIFKNPRLEL